MLEFNKIHCLDCIEGLRQLPDECIQTCITSPPYYGLRDYGTASWEGGDQNCKHQTNYDKRASGKQLTNVDDENLSIEIKPGEKCPLCGALRADKQVGLEKTPEEYIARLVEIFHEVKRVLRKDGTLWLNLGDSYWGGKGQSNQAWAGEHGDRDTLERAQYGPKGIRCQNQ